MALRTSLISTTISCFSKSRPCASRTAFCCHMVNGLTPDTSSSSSIISCVRREATIGSACTVQRRRSKASQEQGCCARVHKNAETWRGKSTAGRRNEKGKLAIGCIPGQIGGKYNHGECCLLIDSILSVQQLNTSRFCNGKSVPSIVEPTIAYTHNIDILLYMVNEWVIAHKIKLQMSYETGNTHLCSHIPHYNTYLSLNQVHHVCTHWIQNTSPARRDKQLLKWG